MFCQSSFDFLICTYFKWTCAGMMLWIKLEITNCCLLSFKKCGHWSPHNWYKKLWETKIRSGMHFYIRKTLWSCIRDSICLSKWKKLPDNNQWPALISRPGWLVYIKVDKFFQNRSFLRYLYKMKRLGVELFHWSGGDANQVGFFSWPDQILLLMIGKNYQVWKVYISQLRCPFFMSSIYLLLNSWNNECIVRASTAP